MKTPRAPMMRLIPAMRATEPWFSIWRIARLSVSTMTTWMIISMNWVTMCEMSTSLSVTPATRARSQIPSTVSVTMITQVIPTLMKYTILPQKSI